MPNAELVARENERKRKTLIDNIARDTNVLRKHNKENSDALSDRSRPDFYFANSKAAVVARRISANLKKVLPLKTRGIDTTSNLIDHYNAVAVQHERNAKNSKPQGYANAGYQKMAKVVEGNRKNFNYKVLRNKTLFEAIELEHRIPRSKKELENANPHLLAKLHKGIQRKMLNAAYYTHFLGDGGTSRTPTVEELIKKIKFHGNKHAEYTMLIRQDMLEKKKRR